MEAGPEQGVDDDVGAREVVGFRPVAAGLAEDPRCDPSVAAVPAISPVEASTPDGRSTDNTGRPLSRIRSISAAASGRGAP